MNTTLIDALEEARAALYGAIGVCGDIGNLKHALTLIEKELKNLVEDK